MLTKGVSILSGAKKNDIPIELSLPPRPQDEVGFDGMDQSIAELAGMAAFLKMVKPDQDTVFFGVTYLGRFAKRWFNVASSSEKLPSDTANWIYKARGKKVFKKLDDHPSLVYAKSNELFKKFGIKFENDDSTRITFGGIDITISDAAYITAEAEVSKRDFHLLVGFAKMSLDYMMNNNSQIPRFRIQGQEIERMMGRTGSVEPGDIINIDPIDSYI